MGYQFGLTAGSLVDAANVFGNDPRSVPMPGSDLVEMLSGNKRWRGHRRSTWYVEFMTLAQYQRAMAFCLSSLGTGTIDTSGTAVTGYGTAFDTQLDLGSMLIYDLGGSNESIGLVKSITDADTLTLAASMGTWTGVAFRYKKSVTYTGLCYVATRVTEFDVFPVFQAWATFKPPRETRREGGMIWEAEIEWVLL